MAVNIELRPKDTYPCDPDKNVECPKTNCYINGGICTETTNPAYKKISVDIPTNLFELLKKDLLLTKGTNIEKIEIIRELDYPFLPKEDPDGYLITVTTKELVSNKEGKTTVKTHHVRQIVSDRALGFSDCEEKASVELYNRIFTEEE